MVEDVAGKALAARPGKRPERWGVALGAVPQAERLGGGAQGDFRYEGHRRRRGGGPDEGLRLWRHRPNILRADDPPAPPGIEGLRPSIASPREDAHHSAGRAV